MAWSQEWSQALEAQPSLAGSSFARHFQQDLPEAARCLHSLDVARQEDRLDLAVSAMQRLEGLYGDLALAAARLRQAS